MSKLERNFETRQDYVERIQRKSSEILGLLMELIVIKSGGVEFFSQRGDECHWLSI
jgi:hypothetical protein